MGRKIEKRSCMKNLLVERKGKIEMNNLLIEKEKVYD